MTAQQFLHVPPAAATAEGNSMFPVAGIDRDARQQILIDASHLDAALGRDIVGVSFRRDRGWSKPLGGGQSVVSIVLSAAPHPPVQASPEFADNVDPSLANHVVVFSGGVSVPASSDARTRPLSWSDPQDVIEFPFTVPYAYRGGHLCVDLTGVGIPGAESRFWAVDAAIDDARGSVSSIGSPCGASSGQPYPDASVADYALVAGSTARFRGYGRVGTAGAFLLGAPMPPFDLSLIGIGGPGCELGVDPFVAVPSSFTALSGDLGCVRSSLQIPAEQASLGFAFRAQFVSMGVPVETTNALDCIVASSLPSLGLATVFASQSPGVTPSRGVVRANRAPVMRFTLR